MPMPAQRLEIAHLTVELTEHPEVWSPLSAIEMLSFLIDYGFLNGLEQRRILDFGTGSGIVGIVCGLLGAAPVTLSDYSAMATNIATQNACRNGLTDVTGIQSDRFAQIPGEPYDLIISNPPVQPWLFTDLAHPDSRQQVAAWNEAGADGRLVLDALLKTAANFLTPGGRLLTSSSSRHGHCQTIQQLETHWAGHWQQIYVAQHAILPDYHGPYMPLWQHLQALDGDLRLYQIDDRGRRFAPQQDTVGEPITVTTMELGGHLQPVILRSRAAGDWSVETPQGEHLTILSATDNRLPGPSTSDRWYYEYYLFEAVKVGGPAKDLLSTNS